jgi:hypothetical protein
MKKVDNNATNKIIVKSEKMMKLLSSKLGYGQYRVAKHSLNKRVVIVDWNSDLGQKKLARAKYKQSFMRLAHNYQSQINPFYCGVACIATVLNSLRARKGLIPNQEEFEYVDPEGNKIEYKYYNQLNVLDEQTDQIKQREKIAPSITQNPHNPNEEFRPGLTLRNVKEILEYHHAVADMHPCERENEEMIQEFRDTIIRVLSERKEYLLLNFDGETCELSTGGHFSTVGAYDTQEDAILILDAAAHKNPWFWVPIKYIYHAMNTKNYDGYRGYIIVRDEIEEYI